MTSIVRSPIRLPWYRREDYPRLLEIVEDPHILAATYGEWLAAAENNAREAARAGLAVERILVEPDAFAAWCEREGVPRDGKARARFAREMEEVQVVPPA